MSKLSHIAANVIMIYVHHDSGWMPHVLAFVSIPIMLGMLGMLPVWV
jgi:hypothetical protein